MLYKVRDFVDANILKSIFYALFESHINYACIIWGQNISKIICLYILQKKALRIVNYKELNAHLFLCFITLNIKITDKVKIENCLFINKYTNNKSPSIFTNWFTFSSMFHNYQTLFTSKGNLQIPMSKQHHMEKMLLFSYMVIKTWNDIQKEIKSVMINTFSLVKLKSLLIEFYLNMCLIS